MSEQSNQKSDSSNRVGIPKKVWQILTLRELLLVVTIFAIWIGWNRDRNKLVRKIERLRTPAVRPNWQVSQVTGPPNTPKPGDYQTAWASKTRDDSKEWLTLNYDQILLPKSIQIHESYNPGAVYKVSAFNLFGDEIILWEGKDPVKTTAASGIAKINVDRWIWTSKIKIYIDSPAVPGWNEIDAVGIIDSLGNKHWASAARASSCYSGGLVSAPGVSTFANFGGVSPRIIIRNEPEAATIGGENQADDPFAN